MVSYSQLGLSEAKLLENYPTLTAIDLVNAWGYHSANPEEVNLAIEQQDKA